MSEARPEPPEPPAQPLAGFAAQRAAALAIVADARLAIEALLAPADLRIYGTPEFGDALRARIAVTPRLRMRVLVPDGLSRRGAQTTLWRVAQDLPTFAALRILANPVAEAEPSWLIADRAALLYRRYPASANGEYDANAPRRVKALRERFEALWNEAAPDPDARRLML
jgi:hypothetical protein